MNAPSIDRRQFTGSLGALVVAFSLDPAAVARARSRRGCPAACRPTASSTAGSASAPTAQPRSSPARWSWARASSRRCAQIAAEELDLPLARVKIVSGDTGSTPNEGMTAGSQSIENSGTALRMAGAEVRAILLDLAAKRLGTDAADGGGRHRSARRTAAS